MCGVGKTWWTCQWLVKLMARAILCKNWIFSSFVVNRLHVSCFCCFTPKDPLSGKVDRASLLESRRLRVIQSHTAVAISELSFSTLSPGLQSWRGRDRFENIFGIGVAMADPLEIEKRGSIPKNRFHHWGVRPTKPEGLAVWPALKARLKPQGLWLLTLLLAGGLNLTSWWGSPRRISGAGRWRVQIANVFFLLEAS